MKKANTIGAEIEDMGVIEAPRTKPEDAPKLGTFVVINTNRIKGLRFNLNNIRSYAKSGENTIQIAYDAGHTTLTYNNEREADEVLQFLDSYCL